MKIEDSHANITINKDTTIQLCLNQAMMLFIHLTKLLLTKLKKNHINTKLEQANSMIKQNMEIIMCLNKWVFKELKNVKVDIIISLIEVSFKERPHIQHNSLQNALKQEKLVKELHTRKGMFHLKVKQPITEIIPQNLY